MRLVQTKQLEGSGIPYKSAQNICFEGTSFVRGITFSNRLRHLADGIYHAEAEAGNACLIVEDETHFTIWHQESTLEFCSVPEAETLPDPSRIKPFVRHFSATNQVKPLQPALSLEPVGRKQPTTNFPAMPSEDYQSHRNASQHSGTVHQTAEFPPIRPRTWRRQPAAAPSTKTSAVRAHWNPDPRFATGVSDPWSKPYLGSFTSSRFRDTPDYSAASEADGNLARVWISLSKLE